MCGTTNLILHFHIDPLEDQNFKRIALHPTSFHVTCHERFANAKSFASCFRIVRRFALRSTTALLQFDPCTEASRPEPRDRGLLLRERHGESLHGLFDARVPDQQLGLHGRYPSIALNFASISAICGPEVGDESHLTMSVLQRNWLRRWENAWGTTAMALPSPKELHGTRVKPCKRDMLRLSMKLVFMR